MPERMKQRVIARGQSGEFAGTAGYLLYLVKEDIARQAVLRVVPARKKTAVAKKRRTSST